MVKNTEEGKKLAAKDFLEEEIAKDKKLKIRLICRLQKTNAKEKWGTRSIS